MNQMQQGPNMRYEFGHHFNYANWPKDTELTFTHVPWNAEYKDVVHFGTQAKLDQWIDSQPRETITHASQKKFQNRKLQVNMPIGDAGQFNYVRARNPLNPVGGQRERAYYYFVTDVAFISGNNTELTLQLDAWATYVYTTTPEMCFIERSHLGIANSKQMQNYGRDYLAVPEGLEIGGEYRIVKTAKDTVMSLSGYSVLVCSTLDLTKNPGTTKAPKQTTAPGGVVDGIATGASFYVFPDPDDFREFMKTYQNYSWITEGIISATLIPDVTRYHAGATLKNVASDVSNAVDLPDGGGVIIDNPPTFTMYEYPAGTSQSHDTALAENWRDDFLNILPAQYRILKKLLTFPYLAIEITTWSGSPLIAKPESWADDNAAIREQAVMLPPAQRIVFMPYRYNADPSMLPTDADDFGDNLDFAAVMDNFPSVPVVNNMYLAYLAQNAHGIAFQFTAADWAQQKALRGAAATQDVANAEIRNTSRQAAAGISALGAQAQLDQEVGGQLGLIGGALGTVSMSGGVSSTTNGRGAGVKAGLDPAALAGYDATAAIQANRTAQTASIAMNARAASALSGITAAGEVRDTNVTLARNNAQGDYQNTIAGIHAKLQDARMMQPSVSGQFNGDAMTLAHNRREIAARWKLMDNSALKRIGTYWLRYGYAIDQYVTPPDDFHCMSKFTYWKMQEAYISGNIPEGYKATIRGILQKGVTVWKNPSDIGDATALTTNTPMDGISY